MTKMFKAARKMPTKLQAVLLLQGRSTAALTLAVEALRWVEGADVEELLGKPQRLKFRKLVNELRDLEETVRVKLWKPLSTAYDREVAKANKQAKGKR